VRVTNTPPGQNPCRHPGARPCPPGGGLTSTCAAPHPGLLPGGKNRRQGEGINPRPACRERERVRVTNAPPGQNPCRYPGVRPCPPGGGLTSACAAPHPGLLPGGKNRRQGEGINPRPACRERERVRVTNTPPGQNPCRHSGARPCPPGGGSTRACAAPHPGLLPGGKNRRQGEGINPRPACRERERVRGTNAPPGQNSCRYPGALPCPPSGRLCRACAAPHPGLLPGGKNRRRGEGINPRPACRERERVRVTNTPPGQNPCRHSGARPCLPGGGSTRACAAPHPGLLPGGKNRRRGEGINPRPACRERERVMVTNTARSKK
jgi:hypothetical protein